MSTSALLPTAPTTLAILLGASAWPNSPGFQASRAFVHAAQGFRDYLLDPHSFGLPAANLLDLFDAAANASDQLEQLGSFLEERAQTLKAANQPVCDVLVYFVGHGGFAGPSADFYLMPHRTNASSLRASGMAIDALAEVLREQARQTRRYLFLDCCFAAAAFRAFQGGPDQTAITKTLDAFHVQTRSSGFPRKGTVLLCSSDQKSPSLLLPDESCTMFSSALLDVLRNGDLRRPPQLSLRDIKELTEDRLAALPEKNAPRPGLHSPDQSEGDVADVPFFPNLEGKDGKRAEGLSRQAFAVALEQANQAGVKVAARSPTRPSPVQEPQIMPAIANASRSGEWAMFGYDAQHTRCNPHERLLSPSNVDHLVLAWTASTGRGNPSSPAVANGLVYVSSGDRMYAFEAATGQERWSTSTGDEISSNMVSFSPAVANGLVYVGSTAIRYYDSFDFRQYPFDHRLYAFEASTGKVLWSVVAGEYALSSPAVANGLVYVGSVDQKLYAFEAASGQLRWSASTGSPIHYSPAVANGLVYVSSGDRMHAFEAASGQERWSTSPKSPISSSPAVANGLVYVGSGDRMHAFEAASGQLCWSASTGGEIRSSPAVANGLVYVGSYDHRLYAFDAATAQESWSSLTGHRISSSPAVANGLVYVCSHDQRLHAFRLG